MGIVFIYGLVDVRNSTIKYVGKTVNLNNRLKQHVNRCHHYLKIKKKRLSKKENWIIELLKLGLKPEILVLKETTELQYEYWEEYYIKKYKERGNILFNYDDKGVGMQNESKWFTERLRKKLSRRVLMYDLNGVFICDYKSLRDAEKKTGINHGNISKVCNRKWKHCSGKVFRFEHDKEIVTKIENPNGIKRSVIEINKRNEIINKWKSLMDCSRETSIDCGNLSKVCNNKLKSYKGRKFKYEKSN